MHYFFAFDPTEGQKSVAVVVVDHMSCDPLVPRLDLWKYHDGLFEAGPWTDPAHNRQLALAMLAYATERDDVACWLHARFAAEMVSRLPCGVPWNVSVEDVLRWVIDTMQEIKDEPLAPRNPAAGGRN